VTTLEATEKKPNPFARGKQFIVEVWAELKKTTWPEMKEVQGTTIVVIVAVLITAAYLYAADLLIVRFLDLVQKMFGR
jgi:preprotein translocase subunit SecE